MKNLKGALHKTEQGWIVKWIDELHGFGGAGWTPMDAVLHPDSQKLERLTEGKEVEFELVDNPIQNNPHSHDFTPVAKILLKKPHKPTQKDCERFIREWVWNFVYDNWDKMDHKKCDLDNMGKDKLLKDVKKDTEWALWVINEVMNWAMDENYSKELTVYDSDEKDVENFKVIKLIDKYVKVVYNTDFTHTVSFVEPKTKTVIVTYWN